MRKGPMIYEGRRMEKHDDQSKHWYHVFRRSHRGRDGAVRRHFLYIGPALLALMLFSPLAWAESKAPVIHDEPDPFAVTELKARAENERMILFEPAPAAAEPKIVYVPVPAAAPEKADGGGKTIGGFDKDLVITVIVCVFFAGTVIVLKVLHNKGVLDADRWAGLVHQIYNAAEKSGALNKWDHKQKLAYGMDIFDGVFIKLFGHAPGERDRADLQADLARMAYDDDTTANARQLELLPSAATATGQPRGVAALTQRTEPPRA